jgi:amino acid transporter
MLWKQLFGKKSLEMLKAEAEGENRLRRVLGPIALTSLGVGAIIGAGIFVMTGRVAAETAGPAILVSFAVAGVGCALAAFCYAEFASMAPVAGSAYTYAYATLGELLAWIIGWDLILEYAMSCATVASAWSEYFNKLTKICLNWEVPWYLSNDPFSKTGAWFNLPAVAILLLVTGVLVIGIRESAASNTVLVLLKVGVVLFVVALGIGYINKDNWTDIPVEERKLPAEALINDLAEEYVKEVEGLKGKEADERAEELQKYAMAVYQTERVKEVRAELRQKDRLTPKVAKRLAAIEKRYNAERPPALPMFVLGASTVGLLNSTAGPTPFLAASTLFPGRLKDIEAVESILADAKEKATGKETESWGLLGLVGLNKSLREVDDKTRSNFAPYGLSGIMLGAAIVFFAFIGFDSISTHAEEAKHPQRDVPIGIIASLLVCTVLYIAVSAVITGMEPYPTIDTKAAIANAFDEKAKVEQSGALKASAALIAAGGLAGMTSVLLITFLSQARIFLAMARDGLLPERIFGAVHEKFKTPHVSTMVTGGIIAVVAAFTPIQDLEKMVNIGTLFAFVIVCIAVMLLRIRRPEVRRPFRCPALFVVAPVGILVNVTMMLFLPLATWLRLVGWLAVGLCIYFSFGVRFSRLAQQ